MVDRLTIKIGFIINPIAGMGGRVGLKGTDGVLSEALDRGAKPVAQNRAREAMNKFVELYEYLLENDNIFKEKIQNNIEFFTCSGSMGFNVLQQTGLVNQTKINLHIVYEPTDLDNTNTEDTRLACEQFLHHKVDLIIFCGGDGTARDVYSVVDSNIQILGIPSGVKMHSGVFATHANVIGELLIDFLKGDLDSADAEILDLDETRYRAGEWNIRLFGVAKTPYNQSLIQRGKHMVESASEEAIKEEIAEYIKEEMEDNKDILYILGSGSTVQAIGKLIGLDITLLGIDAVYQGKLIGKDLNEQEILNLLSKHECARLILSPIGAQGFILGRGNLQLSPEVIKKVGLENIDVISTPAKLADMEALRVDTNDHMLDSAFEKLGYLKVIFGYRQLRLKKLSK
jgi:predicted polyphosphate/ATP-dependent NAD kinase